MNDPKAVLDMIAAIRGGYPTECDFCGQPYGGSRWPVPEEAGEWACNECYARWEREEKSSYRR